MTGWRFDARDSERLDRQYAAPAIVEQRRRTLEALALRAGERVLDIGCGPGYLTLEMAQAVGPNGSVHGIDVSTPMLEVARYRCAEHPWVHLHEADARRMAWSDESVDAAAAVQVYLFVSELAPALAELFRVLRPGGRAVIVDTDWDSVVWHSSDVARMERFLTIWKRRYVHACIARHFHGALRDAGFRIEQAAAIPIVELHGSGETYSAGTRKELPRYVVGKDGVTQADADAWSRDQDDLDAAGRYFFALSRFLFVARKPG